MPDTPLAGEAALRARLDRIRTRHPDPAPEAVAEVVRAVLATLEGDLTATETALLGEVAELGRTIAAAKAEIAALRVQDINVNHIPSATDELDAIVAHTASASSPPSANTISWTSWPPCALSRSSNNNLSSQNSLCDPAGPSPNPQDS